MEKERTEAEILSEQLMLKKEHFSKAKKEDEQKKADEFCEGYKEFLATAKTERECVDLAVKICEENGFKELSTYTTLNPGDKVYVTNKGRNIAAFVIGDKPLVEGINLLGAHIDSPRIDLKQNPLFEKVDFAMLDTHYYGGIVKYQWVALPLAIHGVVCKKDGSTVTLNIGEDINDPVVCITDLLPHLAKDQAKKKLAEAIEGEKLDFNGEYRVLLTRADDGKAILSCPFTPIEFST